MKNYLLTAMAAAALLSLASCKKSASEMSEEARDALSQAEQSLDQASDSMSSMKDRVTSLQESVRTESARLAQVVEEQLKLRQAQVDTYQRNLDRLAPESRAGAANALAELQAALQKAKAEAKKFAEAPALDNREAHEELSGLLDRIDKKAVEVRQMLGGE